MKKLTGTGVALVTPFKTDESVDVESLKNLVKYVTEGGVDYLVVLGTTGESVTLDQDEKDLVVKTVKETNEGKLPVVLGMGGNNTAALLKNIENTDFTGVDAILSVSPFYNKPTQQGIYLHYKEVAEKSPVPVVLYNVPGRTGSNIDSDTTLQLAELDNIAAIKEASGDLEQCMRIIKDKPEDFLVISGEDALTLPIISSGGKGVISVAANAFPSIYSGMVHAALEDNMNLSRKNHYSLLEIISYLFKEGNPGGIKEALKIKEVCGNTLRLPLVNVSEDTSKNLQRLIRTL